MDDLVRYELADRTAILTLQRPEALNALTVPMKEQLVAALEQARDDPAARAVLLTGAGRAFCVGQDLKEHASRLAACGPGEDPLDTVRRHFNPITQTLAGMPKPTVAAVAGTAAGAGAAFAFACDFRIAADDARFLMAFSGIGLSADSGSSWTLPRLVGHGRAAALLLLAEPVDAHAALAMGLVNAVVPLDRLLPAARELADRLAAGPTAAYAAIKEALRYSATAPLEDSLEREAELQSRAGGTRDHRAAVESFLAKQPPTFEGG